MKRSFHKSDIRAIDERTFEFAISSSSVDRHRTVLSLDGWDLDKYNGVFYWMHSTFSDDPNVALGRSTIRFDKKHMVATATFPEEGFNPLADTVRGHVQRNTINMASVGFFPLEDGHMGDKKKGQPEVYHYGRRELFEWSVVHVGSNRDAFKRDIGETTRYLSEEYERLRIIAPDHAIIDPTADDQQPATSNQQPLEHKRVRLAAARHRYLTY